MGQYTKNGLLNGYKRNNKERAELDYYATPTDEVENILNILQYNLNKKIILEPRAGGDHMARGTENYLVSGKMSAILHWMSRAES